MGRKNMVSIFILTDDAVLLILKHLDTQDTMALAYACERFRRICMDGGVFRKVDLTRSPILTTQQGALSKFIWDEQVAYHVKELNISNSRVLNWQIDNQLEEFILTCRHLEALHVLDCGMSFRRLHRILRQAPRLRALSWSLWDFTSQDTEFLVKSMKSTDAICLKNIKHLHLETFQSLQHIQIVKYLVLSRCKDLQELEIYTWQINEPLGNELSFPFPADQMNPPTSVADVLQDLHSLTVGAVGGYSYSCIPVFPHYHHSYKAELYDFVSSVARKKSPGTKWKKLWIAPPIYIYRRENVAHFNDNSLLPPEVHPHELLSVEAITAHTKRSPDAVDKLKTLFKKINDNTVKSLHICEPVSQANSILELCKPILRIGGRALKFLSLSNFTYRQETDEVKNVFLHILFSKCLNITELDLLGWYFKKDICEALSELKHLTKVQLMKCAVSSKYCKNTQVEISKVNLLTFVENCKHITHLDVRGCYNYHRQFSCHLTDGDLLTLVKLRSLKYLTLLDLIIREWAFLQNISEHCKFLTMLRIAFREPLNNSHSPNFLKSAKFLKHLALCAPNLDVASKDFWNLLSHATNLERLCIRNYNRYSLNIPVAVETLKSLPQLHVVHLHNCEEKNFEDFHSQMIRMSEEEKSDRRFFFELATDFKWGVAMKSCISKKALVPNEIELCHRTPILEITRF